MKRKFISLLLAIIMLISCTNIVSAVDERWIEVTFGERYNVTDILSDDYEKNQNVINYYVYPKFNYGTKYSFIASFDSRYLDNVMPVKSLTGKTLKIKVPFDGISQTQKTVWKVIDYDYEEKSNPTIVAKLLKLYYYAEEFRYYYAETLEGDIILLKFRENMKEVPKLLGHTLEIYSNTDKFLYHGKTTYLVNDYAGYKADKDNPDLYDPEIKEYYGVLSSVYMNNIKDNNVSYVFTDSNHDKEYIAFFDIEKEDYADKLYTYKQKKNELNQSNNKKKKNEGTEEEKIFISEIAEEIDEYQVGRKIKLYGYVEGVEDNKEIIVVKEYVFLEDTFTRYDNENVYLTGVVQQNVVSNTNQTVYLMRTTDTAKAPYYIIFDNKVLGNQMPTISLLDKTISVYGVVEKNGNDYYVGVMSYGIIEEENNNNNTAPYTIKEVSISSIISEDAENIIYYGLDKNNKKEEYVFSKVFLKENVPQSSLTNKTFTIAYMPQDGKNYVLAWTEIINENQEYYEKGILIKRLNKNATASDYLFQNSYGEQLTAIIPKELEENLLSEKQIFQDKSLTNKTVYIFGNITTFDGERRILVKDITETNELYINKTTADVITFTGTINSVVSQKVTGIMYNIENNYNDSLIIYFDKTTLGDKYPQYDLLNTNLTIRGLKHSNGILLVTDFATTNTPMEYPVEPEKKYTNPVDFPNMEGFTGIIQLLNIDKTYYTLTTSKNRYVLMFDDKNIENILKENLNNTVYLRGQPDVMGDSFWSHRIKVYDIQPLCFGQGKCTTIINPVNTKIPDYKPDPQKNAIHTIQINGADPKNYQYGLGILESLVIPELPTDLSKDK